MRDGSDRPERHPGLIVEQYRDERRLQSRFAVHESFSTAKINYLAWIFDHILKGGHHSILDLGAGPGYLWQHNLIRVPADWSLYLADASPGMLARAQNDLRELSKQTEFIQLEGKRLAFSTNTMDAALALHVLHLLSDLTAALREIRRVLEPGGKLYAGTNGELHMLELRQALKRFEVKTAYFPSTHGFSVQKGRAVLLELFDYVDCMRFKDALEITQVLPLLEYARSGIPEKQLSGQMRALDRLEQYWEEELQREGVIRIQKETALFIAW